MMFDELEAQFECSSSEFVYMSWRRISPQYDGLP